MPEVWTNFYNMGFENVPNWTENIFPALFITVASWSIMAARSGLPLLLRPLVASATTKLLKNLKIFSIPVRLQCRIGIFSCHLSQNHTKYPRNLVFSVTMCTFANIKQIRL